MTRLEVRGMTQEQIAERLKNAPRARIYQLIHELVAIEEHFTPAEVARARRLSKRKVVELCAQGSIPGAHKPLDNGRRISATGIAQWDDNTRVTPLKD